MKTVITKDNSKAQRKRGLTVANIREQELGLGGFREIPVGIENFGGINRDKHKGHKLMSHGVQIGWTDGVKNINTIKMLLGTKQGGSKNVLCDITGLTIFPEYLDLFDPEILAIFPEAEVQAEVKVLKKGDIKPRIRKKQSWKA